VEADRTAPVYGTGEIEVAAGPETIGGVPGDIGEVVDEPTKLTWTGKTMAIPAIHTTLTTAIDTGLARLKAKAERRATR